MAYHMNRKAVRDAELHRRVAHLRRRAVCQGRNFPGAARGVADRLPRRDHHALESAVQRRAQALQSGLRPVPPGDLHLQDPSRCADDRKSSDSGTPRPFTVRSGGHCTAGFSVGSSFLIDVKNLDSVTFNFNDMTATVGCGCEMQAFIREMDLLWRPRAGRRMRQCLRRGLHAGRRLRLHLLHLRHEQRQCPLGRSGARQWRHRDRQSRDELRPVLGRARRHRRKLRHRPVGDLQSRECRQLLRLVRRLAACDADGPRRRRQCPPVLPAELHAHRTGRVQLPGQLLLPAERSIRGRRPADPMAPRAWRLRRRREPAPGGDPAADRPPRRSVPVRLRRHLQDTSTTRSSCRSRTRFP